MIYLILSLLFIAGFANGIMDATVFHDVFDGHRYWDPDISWRNKYKNGDHNQGQKFPGSTTILVFLTDGWHLAQFAMLTCFSIAVLIAMISVTWEGLDWYEVIGVYLIIRLAFGAGFWLSYNVIFKR